MHEKDGEAKGQRAQKDVARVALAVGHPDCRDAEPAGTEHRDGNAGQGIDRSAEFEPRHSEVMHRDDAKPDDEPGNRQAARAAGAEVQQQEGQTDHQNGDQRRAKCDHRIVIDRDRQAQSEHGHEMHRPDAAAKRDGGERDGKLAQGDGLGGNATGQRKPGKGGHQRDAERGGHQPGVMGIVKKFHHRACGWAGAAGQSRGARAAIWRPCLSSGEGRARGRV